MKTSNNRNLRFRTKKAMFDTLPSLDILDNNWSSLQFQKWSSVLRYYESVHLFSKKLAFFLRLGVRDEWVPAANDSPKLIRPSTQQFIYTLNVFAFRIPWGRPMMHTSTAVLLTKEKLRVELSNCKTLCKYVLIFQCHRLKLSSLKPGTIFFTEQETLNSVPRMVLNMLSTLLQKPKWLFTHVYNTQRKEFR